MATPTPRRWLRYSLRSMLGLVTVFGLWLGVQVNRAEQQRRAVAAIERLGGKVHYDWKWRRGWTEVELNREVEARKSARLRKLLGDHYFDTVVAVDLMYPENNLTDPDLDYLLEFPKLEQVWLTHQPITDKGISQLAHIKTLRILDLQKTAISDACLDDILRLPNLEWLNVGETRVTARGLTHLLKMPKLRELYISAEQLRTAGGWEGMTKALPGIRILVLFDSEPSELEWD
ncbi:MAG: hypothetical protein WD847_21170 [Pirellulales bacterium]